jgi:hypothetical protein
MLRFHLQRFDPAADFDAAARIYRRCRQAGVTPRGLVDCMITGSVTAIGPSCSISSDRRRSVGLPVARSYSTQAEVSARIT